MTCRNGYSKTNKKYSGVVNVDMGDFISTRVVK